MTSFNKYFLLPCSIVALLFIPQVSLSEEWIKSPQMIFDIYSDAGQELHPDCWIGAGNGDSITEKDNRCYTTFPDGPSYEGSDSMIFEWEHKSGWASFVIARDWWIPIDISEFVKYKGYVQFMIKGEKGGEDMNVNLGLGENKSSPQVKISDYLENSITTNWQKVVIPLNDFNYNFETADNKAHTVSFTILGMMKGKFRVYVDNLYFVHFYGDENKKDKLLFRPDDFAGHSKKIQKKVDKPGGVIVDKWRLAETLDMSFDKLKDLGIKYIKLDFPWVNIEPKKGSYRFVDYSQIIEKCRQNNIEILGCIKDTPLWAKKEDIQNNFIKYPPQQLNDFASFVLHLATRYRNDITYWQIWEDQDDFMSTSEYCGLLKYAYIPAKMANPDSIILSGQTENMQFLNGLQNCRYYDIIGIDIKLSSDNPKKILASFNQELNSIIKKEKFNRNIWITSIGKINHLNSGISDCKKAKIIEEFYPQLLSNSCIKNIFWCDFMDNSNNAQYGKNGLIDEMFSEKCSYKTYKQLVKSK